MPWSNQGAITKDTDWWLKRQKFISHSSGVWKSEIRVSPRILTLGCLFAKPSHGGERSSFYEGTNPVYEGSTLMTPLSTTGSTFQYHHVGIRVSTYESWEEPNFQPTADYFLISPIIQHYPDTLDSHRHEHVHFLRVLMHLIHYQAFYTKCLILSL